MKKVMFLFLITGSLVLNAAAPTEEMTLEQELKEAILVNDIDDVEELLQESGINVNARDQLGWTALMWAVQDNNQPIVERLLEIPGIDVDVAGNDGMTPLMWAARDGYFEIVKKLLERGADKTKMNSAGMTVARIAQDAEHGDIADYIRDYEQTPVKSAKKR